MQIRIVKSLITVTIYSHYICKNNVFLKVWEFESSSLFLIRYILSINRITRPDILGIRKLT
jgi:hypothetical protein